MKKIVSDTQVIDYYDQAKEFLEIFPNAKVELIEYGFDKDCDGNRFHDYQITVAGKNATKEMLDWAAQKDLLGNGGYGLDDDADDNDCAISIPVQAAGYGDLWIVNE